MVPDSATPRTAAYQAPLSMGFSRQKYLGGVLLCSSVRQVFDGPASPIVHLPMLVCGEREAMVMAPPLTRDSATSPCSRGCLALLHRHFPPQSPSHPLNPSLCSQQQRLPWDCSTIPKLQLRAAAPSRVPAFLSGICMAVARTDSQSEGKFLIYPAIDQLFPSQP